MSYWFTFETNSSGNQEDSIGTDAAVELCQALKVNTGLQILDLGMKKRIWKIEKHWIDFLNSFKTDDWVIDSEIAKELSEVLKTNSSLTSLLLRLYLVFSCDW